MVSKEKTGIIYRVTNRVNGKIYIGQTIRSLSQRRGGHYSNKKDRKTHLSNAIAYYGKENFSWDILCIIQLADKWLMDSAEEAFIRYYKSYDRKLGYNKTFGGSKSCRTNEVRNKIIKIKKELVMSAAWVEKIRLANRSEEKRKAISNGLKEMYSKMTPKERKEKCKSLAGHPHIRERAYAATRNKSKLKFQETLQYLESLPMEEIKEIRRNNSIEGTIVVLKERYGRKVGYSYFKAYMKKHFVGANDPLEGYKYPKFVRERLLKSVLERWKDPKFKEKMDSINQARKKKSQ